MNILRQFSAALLILMSLAFSGSAHAARESFAQVNATAHPGYGGNVSFSLVSGSVQVFAYSTFGGIARSDDGATWAPKNSGLTGLGIRGLGVNSLLTSNVYAVGIDGAGFYKSTNSGNTWVPLPIAGSGLPCRVIPSFGFILNNTTPASPHIFVLATCPDSTAGIYKSEDGGTTWLKTSLTLPAGAVPQGLTIFTSNNTSMTYSARVATSVGFYQTTDGGPGNVGTWASINGTGLSGNIGQNGLYSFNASTGVSGTSVLASILGQGIFRTTATAPGSVSTTGSAVWTQTLGSLPAPKHAISGIFQRFAGDTNRYVTIDGEGTWVTTDSGLNWTLDASLAFSKSIRQVARDLVNSTVFWASSYDGLFKSTDSGATYTKVTAAGLPPAYMNFTSVSPANPLNLFAVGGGSFYSSTSGGLVWNRITAIPHIGFGGGHIAKPTTSGTSVYAATPSGGVYKSNDNGATWGQLSIPSLMTGSVGPIGRLRIRAQDDSTVYLAVGANGLASAGGGSGPQYDDRFDRNKVGLYKTINGGATWTTLSIGTTGVVSFGRPVGAVNAMDIAPGSPSTLVAATGSGIFKSTDTGANWRLVGPAVVYGYNGVSTASLIPSAPGVGAVRYDPLNANNLIATSWDIDNYGRATALSALYRSRDGGETWQAMATYEKVGSGFAFVTTNGRTVPYVTSGGYFDDAPSANLIFRCPDLFTVSDPQDMKCAPARVETTADGVPGSFAQTVVANIAGVNQLIGVSAVGLGMQVVRRTNIGPDFNNDGVADVLWRNTGAGGQNFIWRMEKAASNRTLVHQTESAFLPTVPTDWVIGGYGDFNGDGNTDILWRNTTTGDTYIYLMDGTTVLAGSGYTRNVPTAWSPVGVEDFDGDGKADILWRNGTTGDTYFYLMNGLTIVAEGYGRNVPTAWNVAGTSDLDGDGKFDILWRNGGTGDNYVYFMNGLSISSEGYLPTVADPNWVIKGIGNYTNDTAARGILWSNATTRLNFLWRMNGTGLNIDGACSTLGCDNNANYLPSAPAGWAIIK